MFYKNGGLEEAQSNADEIQKYIFERGYKAEVRIERFDWYIGRWLRNNNIFKEMQFNCEKNVIFAA